MEKNNISPVKNFNIYYLLIIDQSGSMMPLRQMAISSINETLQTIRSFNEDRNVSEPFVSIVTFSGDGRKGVKTVRDRISASCINDFEEKDFVPNGCTPLYDAIGLSVTSLEKNIRPCDKVMVTIITDGYENTSEEFSATSIKSIIDMLRRKGWTFGFIGANQDAVLTANGLGIRNALNYDCTEEGMSRMSERMSDSLRCYEDRIELACKLNRPDLCEDLNDIYVEV